MPFFSEHIECKHVTTAFALGIVLFLPACDSSPEKQASSESDNPKSIIASWKDFVRQAKAREHLAVQSWQTRDGNYGGPKFKVDWIHQDVKKSDSLTSPVIGYVKLRAHAYSKYGNHFINEYVLEFTPDAGNVWRYRTGTNQRLDNDYGDADKEPQPYVTLKYEMKVLFSK